jgi:uncharacterized protein YcaQ
MSGKAVSHHHTLWTRQSKYDETMLHALQANDRRVFEYWGRAMCYLTMKDFRYALPRMRNFEDPTHPWTRFFMKNKTLLNHVNLDSSASQKSFHRTRNHEKQ